jgi:regulatory protein
MPPGRPPQSPRPAKSLKARAVGYLARREYSRAELRNKLIASGASREEADAALDEMAALGYLSDARFAAALVEQKGGAMSKRAISASLKAKGVSPDVASEALAASEVDDHDAMVALWLRKFGTPPSNDRDKARQVRFLQSRGFALSAIFRMLRNPPSD